MPSRRSSTIQATIPSKLGNLEPWPNRTRPESPRARPACVRRSPPAAISRSVRRRRPVSGSARSTGDSASSTPASTTLGASGSRQPHREAGRLCQPRRRPFDAAQSKLRAARHRVAGVQHVALFLQSSCLLHHTVTPEANEGDASIAKGQRRVARLPQRGAVEGHHSKSCRTSGRVVSWFPSSAVDHGLTPWRDRLLRHPLLEHVGIEERPATTLRNGMRRERVSS